MSDVDKFIAKKDSIQPGFKQKVEEEIYNLNLGEQIKQMRLARGWTQLQLAEELNTTKSAISRLENHTASMRLSNLEKIAKVFDKKVLVSFE